MPPTTLTIDHSVFYNEKNIFDNLYSTTGNLESMLKCFDPQDKYSKGIIFCIPSKILDKFEYLNIKAERGEKLRFLNSTEFVKSISGYSIFMTDEEVIEVDITYDNKIAMNNLITASSLLLSGKKEKEVKLYYYIENMDLLTERKIKEISRFGFYDISVKSPLFYGKGKDEGFPQGLYLIKTTDISYNTKPRNYNILSGKINLYKTLTDSPFCYINIRISVKTKKILQEMVRIGGTRISNGKTTQRELSGCFVVRDHDNHTLQKNGKNKETSTFKLSLDTKSTKCNKEEDAEIAPCKYNFHTHPYKAYINNNTKYAWPSCSDYKAFLVSFYEYGTIFHILASLEGIYIISVHPDWVNNKKLLERDAIKHIESKYDMIEERNTHTPDEYIEIVGGYHFKGKEPIFNVEYERYEEKGKSHNVFFPKKNGGCIV